MTTKIITRIILKKKMILSAVSTLRRDMRILQMNNTKKNTKKSTKTTLKNVSKNQIMTFMNNKAQTRQKIKNNIENLGGTQKKIVQRY